MNVPLIMLINSISTNLEIALANLKEFFYGLKTPIENITNATKLLFGVLIW